jgi:hypothetical protein
MSRDRDRHVGVDAMRTQWNTGRSFSPLLMLRQASSARELLVTERHVGGRGRVVVAVDDELAVEPLGGFYRRAIDGEPRASLPFGAVPPAG